MKDQPIIVERLLNAPPEKEWKAITETEGMKNFVFGWTAIVNEIIKGEVEGTPV
jgi:uncharacterized protein YndB with AHSA1/START domain